jgi:hypothetical protein
LALGVVADFSYDGNEWIIGPVKGAVFGPVSTFQEYPALGSNLLNIM